jgi:anti-sigma regulatory factor (Ser/Thr protein kinase)
LCLSELVTNAVLHAQTEVVVRVAIDARHVHVDVDDADPDLPVARHAAADAVSGRGLDLVSRLSNRWGVLGRGDGKTVWFELDAEPVPTN